MFPLPGTVCDEALKFINAAPTTPQHSTRHATTDVLTRGLTEQFRAGVPHLLDRADASPDVCPSGDTAEVFGATPLARPSDVVVQHLQHVLDDQVVLVANAPCGEHQLSRVRAQVLHT